MNEGWAYHYGHYLTGLRYTTKASCTSSQDYGNVFCPPTTNPHWAALESFRPNLFDDPFRWIPKGIFEDLRDNTPAEPTVVDQASGFTNQQLINAIDFDVRSPLSYRNRFLQENGNAQATAVNTLFNQYNY